MSKSWGHVLLLALCVGSFSGFEGFLGTPRVWAVEGNHPEADKLAVALRDALASGEFKRVRWVAPQAGPLGMWLGERWHEMRSGSWSPRSWQVDYQPYYVQPNAMAGVLQIQALTARGTSLSESFQVEALRRGGVWVFGDSIPLGRPDARVERQDINLDLRVPGRLRAEVQLHLKSQGPDRRLFFQLAEGLRATGAWWGGAAVPFQQRGTILYVAGPVVEANKTLKLRWEGSSKEVVAPFTRGAVSRLTGAWWPQQAVSGRAIETKLAVMLPAGWVSLVPGEPAQVERFADGWLYRHWSDGPVSDLPLWVGDWAHQENRPGVTPVTGYAQPPQAGFLAAAASEVQAMSGFFAEQLALPTPRHWLLAEAGSSPSRGQGNVLLLSSETLASDVMRRAFFPGALVRALLERGGFEGEGAEQALLRDGLSGYLALQWVAEMEGLDVFRARLWEAVRRYETLVGTPLDQPLQALEAELPAQARRILLEDKAVMIFHMLRNRLGQPAFNRAVQEWVAGTERTWRAFVAACEAEAKGSLGEFFSQWLGRPARPEVVLNDVRVERAGSSFAVFGKLTQVGEPFAVRLPLVLSTTGRARIYHLELGPGEVEFKLLAPDRPVRLRVDPARDWLIKGPGPLELSASEAGT